MSRIDQLAEEASANIKKIYADGQLAADEIHKEFREASIQLEAEIDGVIDRHVDEITDKIMGDMQPLINRFVIGLVVVWLVFLGVGIAQYNGVI